MGTRVKKLAVSVVSLTTIVSGITLIGIQGSGAGTVNRSVPRTGTLEGGAAGAAFAMTNRSQGNRIITYSRAADGTLTRVDSVATRGTGIGTDLDTQDGLLLSSDHRFLYAVNAGSDNITVFSVAGTELTFLQKVYAGDVPNSLTIHGNLLYVLDGSVAGNGIRGFTVADNGTLTRLPHSFRLLSSPIAVPGEVQFSPDGRFLLVTHKTTNVLLPPKNAIDVFRVGDNGLASALPKREPSHGLRPFSLAFREDGKLLVVESFNAADNRSAVTSYDMTSGGALDVITGSIRNGQTDSCWIVITDDGRHAFVANFGSGTISSYRVGSAGQIRLIEGRAAFLGADSQPVDLALSADNRYLYLLLRGTGGVASFEIESGGELDPMGIVTGGLPVADGASGLAVY